MIRMIVQLPLQTKHFYPASLRSPRVIKPPGCFKKKWWFQQPGVASTAGWPLFTSLLKWSSPTRIQQRLTMQASGLVLEPWASVPSWLCYHASAPGHLANLHMATGILNFTCQLSLVPSSWIYKDLNRPSTWRTDFLSSNCPTARPLENILGFNRIKLRHRIANQWAFSNFSKGPGHPRPSQAKHWLDTLHLGITVSPGSFLISWQSCSQSWLKVLWAKKPWNLHGWWTTRSTSSNWAEETNECYIPLYWLVNISNSFHCCGNSAAFKGRGCENHAPHCSCFLNITPCLSQQKHEPVIVFFAWFHPKNRFGIILQVVCDLEGYIASHLSIQQIPLPTLTQVTTLNVAKGPQDLLLARFETRGFTQTQAQKQYLQPVMLPWGFEKSPAKTKPKYRRLNKWKLKCFFAWIWQIFSRSRLWLWINRWSLVANWKMNSKRSVWKLILPGIHLPQIQEMDMKLCTTWNAAIAEHTVFKRVCKMLPSWKCAAPLNPILT